MIKEIVHDIVFLQQKALPAFPGDRQTALDLLDTLAAIGRNVWAWLPI